MGQVQVHRMLIIIEKSMQVTIRIIIITIQVAFLIIIVLI